MKRSSGAHVEIVHTWYGFFFWRKWQGWYTSKVGQGGREGFQLFDQTSDRIRLTWTGRFWSLVNDRDYRLREGRAWWLQLDSWICWRMWVRFGPMSSGWLTLYDRRTWLRRLRLRRNRVLFLRFVFRLGIYFLGLVDILISSIYIVGHEVSAVVSLLCLALRGCRRWSHFLPDRVDRSE